MLRLPPLSFGLALVVVSGAGAWAATPSAELRGFFADATLILTNPETDGKHAERLTAIRDITRQIFDFREASRLALGPVWRERTPAERDTFVQLYADLLERAFIAWIAARAQIAGGPRVTFLGETVDEGHATVRTTVLGRTGRELSLDYRMIERGDRWAVRDVVIDGVSLAANYRAQFTRVIQSSSYPELVRQLQSRMSVPPPEAIASGESRPAPDALGVPPAQAPPAPSGAPSAITRDAPPAAPLPRLVAVTVPETSGLDVTPRVGPAPGRTDGVGTGSTTPQEAASRPAVYWVQVAAFKSQQAAARLASLLRGNKASPSHRSSDQWAVIMTSGPDVARVRVGPFADRAEAELGLRQLEARGFKPFIAEDRERAR